MSFALHALELSRVQKGHKINRLSIRKPIYNNPTHFLVIQEFSGFFALVGIGGDSGSNVSFL